MTTKRIAVAALLLIAITMLATGCGKKKWPEHLAPEETFSFENIDANKTGGCMVITGNLTGNTKNLDVLYVQMEADSCIGCPFEPTDVKFFQRGDKGLVLDGRKFVINICNLRTNAVYRWKLVGSNIHASMGNAESEIEITK